ncbi:MAG: RNA polymerase sigma factor [Myxococcota bacterium]
MNALILDDATIRALEPTLIGYAQKRVGRPDLAHDLVQETWAAALGSWNSFAGRSSLRTWLVSILRRKIIDVYRRERPSVSFLEERHGDPAGDPQDKALDDQAAVAHVEVALRRLPEKERTAVELIDVRQLERDEAAEAMGVTRNHLRVLLHRGRHKLRASLESRERVAA